MPIFADATNQILQWLRGLYFFPVFIFYCWLKIQIPTFLDFKLYNLDDSKVLQYFGSMWCTIWQLQMLLPVVKETNHTGLLDVDIA